MRIVAKIPQSLVNTGFEPLLGMNKCVHKIRVLRIVAFVQWIQTKGVGVGGSF